MNRLNRNKQAHKSRPVKHKKLFKRTHNPVTLKKLAIAFAITLIAVFAYVKVYPHTFEAKQTHKLQNTVHQLQQTKQQLEQSESKSRQDDEAKQKQIEELNKQIQEKDAQLQAKAATKSVYAATVDPPARVYSLPEDEAKAYIYSHESGNNPGAINASSGACGLGQALPCSKMPCSLTDYACQDQFFTNYAMQRYGSWNNARAFWVANHWW